MREFGKVRVVLIRESREALVGTKSAVVRPARAPRTSERHLAFTRSWVGQVLSLAAALASRLTAQRVLCESFARNAQDAHRLVYIVPSVCEHWFCWICRGVSK